MAFVRGRYGVEYTPRRRNEPPRLGRAALVLALVALAAFGVTKIVRAVRGRTRVPDPPPPVAVPLPPPAAPAAPAVTNAPARASRPPAAPPPAAKPLPLPPAPVVAPPPPAPKPAAASAAEKRAREWLDTAETRSPAERVLLEKLAEAERRGEFRNAIDAIEKLAPRPALADLRAKLETRLGELNLKYLFSGSNTPWTVSVKVRRGDSRDRIAREHRMTPRALERLNPKTDWQKIRPGDTVRALEYPSPVLVIHKRLGTADLALLKNGKFFRRYTLEAAPGAAAGVYPVGTETGTTLRARFKELVRAVSAADRAELEMFLAPGARITVADP